VVWFGASRRDPVPQQYEIENAEIANNALFLSALAGIREEIGRLGVVFGDLSVILDHMAALKTCGKLLQGGPVYLGGGYQLEEVNGNVLINRKRKNE